MFNIADVHKEFYAIVLGLALVFSLMTMLQHRYLIAIVIVLLVSYVCYLYLDNAADKKVRDGTSLIDTVLRDVKDRQEVNGANFYIDKFPKNMKYLSQSNEFLAILTNIRFITKFNRSVYGDLVLNMNKMMKIYIYMLSGRYEINTYIPMFVDIRNETVDMLQSLVMIVPQRMKHTYGLDTYQEIGRSMTGFEKTTDEMLGIVSRYAKIHLKSDYVYDTRYEPYNSKRH